MSSDFVEKCEEKKGEQFPHNAKLFTCEIIASKIKDLRKSIRKPLILADDWRWENCGDLLWYVQWDLGWVSCNYTSLHVEHGLDSADFQVASVTSGMWETNPIGTHASVKIHLSVADISILPDESSEVESTSVLLLHTVRIINVKIKQMSQIYQCPLTRGILEVKVIFAVVK